MMCMYDVPCHVTKMSSSDAVFAHDVRILDMDTDVQPIARALERSSEIWVVQQIQETVTQSKGDDYAPTREEWSLRVFRWIADVHIGFSAF